MVLAINIKEKSRSCALVCGYRRDAVSTESGSDRVSIPGRLGLISQPPVATAPVLTLLRLLIYQRGSRI